MPQLEPIRDAPLPFDPNDPSFNRTNALYLAHASDVAYLRTPAAAAQQRLGLRALAFRNKLTRTRGFLGICDTHAVLSFRGTDPVTLPNWLTVAVVRLVASAEHEGRVHLGFSSALKRTWNMVAAALDEVGDKPLFLTGHSLGGALAVLAACRLAKIGRPAVATYTFGSPRIGDPGFCAGYALPTYRVVNRLDLVPELPLTSAKKLVPAKARLTNEKIRSRIEQAAERMLCYGHVNRLVYIDRDGAITLDAQVAPWTAEAVAQAFAARGKTFLTGITDHLIANYIRSLETEPNDNHIGIRRT